MLNKQQGNMYGFVDYTWNPIRGKCEHKCEYCYMIGFPVGKLRLDRKSFFDDLGKGDFIFVGSSTDMFANNVPFGWIADVLEHCRRFDTRYLFQTKNPKRYLEFLSQFPKDSVLGTTIETNRPIPFSKAPKPIDRIRSMYLVNKKTMISMEPVLDFDMVVLYNMICALKPEFVTIGADSKNHKLPEPDPEKIKKLIKSLKKFTKVIIKDNLKRIWDG